jgi:hypothetical protein
LRQALSEAPVSFLRFWTNADKLGASGMAVLIT